MIGSPGSPIHGISACLSTICRLAVFGVILLSPTLNVQAQGTQLAGLCPAAVDVLTHRNSNARTGANLCEAALTPDLLNHRFGKVFEFPVAGQVYAQPLIATHVAGVAKAAGPVNLAVVATMENFVYNTRSSPTRPLTSFADRAQLQGTNAGRY